MQQRKKKTHFFNTKIKHYFIHNFFNNRTFLITHVIIVGHKDVGKHKNKFYLVLLLKNCHFKHLGTFSSTFFVFIIHTYIHIQIMIFESEYV